MKESIPEAVLLSLIVAGTALLILLEGVGQHLEPAAKIFLSCLTLFVTIQLIPAFVLFACLVKGIFGRTCRREEHVAETEIQEEAILSPGTNETGRS